MALAMKKYPGRWLLVRLAGTARGAACGGISDQILIDCAIHLDAFFFSEHRHACTRHALNHTCSWSLGEHEQGRRQDEERGAHLDREVNLGCPSLSRIMQNF